MSRKKAFVVSLVLFAILVWVFLRIWDSTSRDNLYQLVDLRIPNSSAFEINNQGMVLGRQEEGKTSRSFVWSESAGAVFPGTGVVLTGVNDLGYAVGHIQNSTNDPGAGVIWKSGIGLHAAEEIGFDQPLTGRLFHDINNKNQIVGSLRGQLAEPLKEHRAFVWDVTQGLRIVETSRGFTFRTHLINDHGFFVGSASAEGSFFSFLGRGKEMFFPMENAPPDVNRIWFSQINSRGDLAGVITTVTDEDKSCLWRNGKITYLSGLGGMNSAALGINEAGITVGHSYTRLDDFVLQRTFWMEDWKAKLVNRLLRWKPGWHTPSAVVWTGEKIQDLNSITEMGADWFLAEAAAVNNRGQIVGSGYYGEEERAFLLNPIE